MIARITGRLEQTTESSALVDTGNGLTYEVLVPACDIERLGARVGQDVTLFTIHYLEGDPSHGAVTPRLVGFAKPEDRAFFRAFTTVKGIGIRKALRALARPIGEIASAIVAKDARFLVSLPEIGKRTAEQIITELQDRVGAFAGETAAATGEKEELSEPAREAVAVLIQLGERRADATALVERVLAVTSESHNAEEILRHAYRLKATGI